MCNATIEVSCEEFVFPPIRVHSRLVHGVAGAAKDLTRVGPAKGSHLPPPIVHGERETAPYLAAFWSEPAGGSQLVSWVLSRADGEDLNEEVSDQVSIRDVI